MRKLAIAICGATAAVALCGCAEGDYFGPGPRYASAAGPMDVWYDGFYGPFGGGYWDGDSFFYHHPDGRFLRDEGQHFRHEGFASARGFHSTPRPR
jgi:hypothetical protein